MNGLSILVIDAWPPTPDRDSASLRIVNLLSILAESAERVTFGVGDAPDWRRPDEWRSRIPTSQRLPLELLEGHAAIESHLHQQGRRYDVVVLSRLSTASRYLRTVRACAPRARVVFDTTDLHFLRGYRGAKVTGNVGMLKSALSAKREELALARQADCTVVVSAVEKAILEDESPGVRVHVVSNIHTVRGSQRPFDERRGILFVGAFPHHPNTDGMAYFLRDIYPLLRAARPEIPIEIIGSSPPDWLKSSVTDCFSVIDHVPDIEPHLDRCRLSIAPLRYGAGVKGKVLLSLSCGVPVVASTIAAEGIPAENGRDMLIADTPEGFCSDVLALYTTESLWNVLSARGVEIVDQHFSFDAARRSLHDLFDSLGLDGRA